MDEGRRRRLDALVPHRSLTAAMPFLSRIMLTKRVKR
jgi:hypothetical protein